MVGWNIYNSLKTEQPSSTIDDHIVESEVDLDGVLSTVYKLKGWTFKS